MEDSIKLLMDEIGSKNNKIRKKALDTLLELSEEKVDWIYNVWDSLVDKLDSNNSYQRSIGMFILANLAKSDSDNKFIDIIDKYLQLMEDEKFITSRQAIKSSWKVAVAIEELRSRIVNHLFETFSNNKHLSSHANLIRYDVVESLVNIYKYDNNAVDLNAIKFIIEVDCDKKEMKKIERIFLH